MCQFLTPLQGKTAAVEAATAEAEVVAEVVAEEMATAVVAEMVVVAFLPMSPLMNAHPYLRSFIPLHRR